MIGFLFAIFSAMSFSLNNIFSKDNINKIGVWNTLLVTYFFVSLISFIFVLIWGNFNHALNYKIILLIIFGGINGMIGIWALFSSFEKISVAESLAIANFFPFISLIFFYFFMEKSVRIIDIFIMCFVFIGVLLTLKKEKFAFNKFLLFSVITAFSWALYYYILAILNDYGISPMNNTFYIETGIFISVVFYMLFIKKDGIKFKFEYSSIKNGFFAGLFSVLGILLFIFSLEKLNPSIATSIISSQIMFSSFFAYIFFNEKLDIRQIIGILIVVLGLILFNIL